MGQVHVVALGDVRGTIVRSTRTGGLHETLPRRFSSLTSKVVIDPFANKLRNGLRLAGRQRLQTFVLVRAELGPGANHGNMSSLACMHDEPYGTRRRDRTSHSCDANAVRGVVANLPRSTARLERNLTRTAAARQIPSRRMLPWYKHLPLFSLGLQERGETGETESSTQWIVRRMAKILSTARAHGCKRLFGARSPTNQ